MRKLVFVAIRATRGSSACRISPVMPRRVATRTGLKMQACAIMSAGSSGASVGTAVDMRRSSPRLGQWAAVELSADNKRQLWIPPGFAHGFVVLSDSADFLYKTTDYYAPQFERALLWNDAEVAIEWPLAELRGPVVLSGKDAAAPKWTDAEFFE
jgi:dTDP-4-dehydrorhamnose 3,5-epimerase